MYKPGCNLLNYQQYSPYSIDDNRLKEYRVKAKLSIRTLANLSRISVTTIGGVEVGSRKPTNRFMHKMSQLLNVEIGELFPRDVCQLVPTNTKYADIFDQYNQVSLEGITYFQSLSHGLELDEFWSTVKHHSSSPRNYQILFEYYHGVIADDLVARYHVSRARIYKIIDQQLWRLKTKLLKEDIDHAFYCTRDR